MKLNIPSEVKNSIRFLGFVAPSDLPKIFSRASVFVSPAISGESFGIVLLEAMATETPVIASSIPGYRCVVEDEKNGLLVTPANSKEIADKVINLLEDKNLCDTLVEGGLRTVAKYSWDVVAKDIMDFYYEVDPTLP